MKQQGASPFRDSPAMLDFDYGQWVEDAATNVQTPTPRRQSTSRTPRGPSGDVRRQSTARLSVNATRRSSRRVHPQTDEPNQQWATDDTSYGELPPLQQQDGSRTPPVRRKASSSRYVDLASPEPQSPGARGRSRRKRASISTEDQQRASDDIQTDEQPPPEQEEDGRDARMSRKASSSRYVDFASPESQSPLAHARSPKSRHSVDDTPRADLTLPAEQEDDRDTWVRRRASSSRHADTGGHDGQSPLPRHRSSTSKSRSSRFVAVQSDDREAEWDPDHDEGGQGPVRRRSRHSRRSASKEEEGMSIEYL